MFDLIFWIVLLNLNLYFGINDIREKKPADWRVALTWTAVGTSWIMMLKSAGLFF